MRCERCGYEFRQSQTFCGNCGSRLRSAQADSSQFYGSSIAESSHTGKNSGRSSRSLGVAMSILIIAVFSFLMYIDVDRKSPGVPTSVLTAGRSGSEIAVQDVGGLSLKLNAPLVENEDLLKLYEATAQSRPASLLSVELYTSSTPGCGIWMAQLSVSTYRSGTELNLDAAALGTLNSLATKPDISDPEGTIENVTVSGFPARRISFQARQSGGVVGSEVLTIVDHDSRKSWDLQIIMFDDQSSDFSAIDKAKDCAKLVLDSAAVTWRSDS